MLFVLVRVLQRDRTNSVSGGGGPVLRILFKNVGVVWQVETDRWNGMEISESERDCEQCTCPVNTALSKSAVKGKRVWGKSGTALKKAKGGHALSQYKGRLPLGQTERGRWDHTAGVKNKMWNIFVAQNGEGSSKDTPNPQPQWTELDVRFGEGIPPSIKYLW